MLGHKNGGVQVQQYVYDFSVDGGAAGVLDLSGKSGYKDLEVGAIVRSVTAKVLTTCTSGGSATIVYGPTADADGYSGAAIAVASLTAGAIFTGMVNAGGTAALLWDDTNDAALLYNVGAANASDLTLTIATAALTAGKILFEVEFTLPSVSA